MNFDLEAAAQATGGRAHGAVAGRSHIVTDSRTAGPGTAFVALVGEKHDAHDFLQQVAAAGVDLIGCDDLDAFAEFSAGSEKPGTGD